MSTQTQNIFRLVSGTFELCSISPPQLQVLRRPKPIYVPMYVYFMFLSLFFLFYVYFCTNFILINNEIDAARSPIRMNICGGDGIFMQSLSLSLSLSTVGGSKNCRARASAARSRLKRARVAHTLRSARCRRRGGRICTRTRRKIGADPRGIGADGIYTAPRATCSARK